VVLCLGLDETIEGEEADEGNAYGSGDKADLELPLTQQELLQSITKIGKPVIVCMLAGSSMNLTYAKEHSAAILQVWYPGASGGRAVADILFGKTSPSGKLPITFYKSADDLPDFQDYAMENRTYRYYKGEPLYPFGYGLTYANVQCTQANVVSQEEDKIVIGATLHNASEVETEDVLQVYVKNLDSKYAVTNVSLCAFKRVSLQGNEEQEVQLEIRSKEFDIYDDEGVCRRDGTNYELYVGMSMPDERSAQLMKTRPIKLEIKL